MAKQTKKLIFISHKSSENTIAIALKNALETAFLNVAEFFVSSDPVSLPPGKAWFNQIIENLKKSSVQLIIASPSSVKRPWINFEAGAIFITDKPVIPICHSGITKESLPKPLDELQGVNAHDSDELNTILPTIAKALDCDVPSVDFSNFIKSIDEYENTTEELKEFNESQTVELVEGLSPVVITILGAIANVVTDPNDSRSCYSIHGEVQKAGMNQIATNLGFVSLQRHGLIELNENEDNYDSHKTATITGKGWEFIQRNQQLFCLNDKENKIDPAESFYDTNDDVPF